MRLSLLIGVLIFSCCACLGSMMDLQDAIKESNFKKASELCEVKKLLKVQQNSLLDYARRILEERRSNIVYWTISHKIATIAKCLNFLAVPFSKPYLSVLLFGCSFIFDPRGIGILCVSEIKSFEAILLLILTVISEHDKSSPHYCKLENSEKNIQTQLYSKMIKPVKFITSSLCLGFLALEYYLFKRCVRQKKELEDVFENARKIVLLFETLPIQE